MEWNEAKKIIAQNVHVMEELKRNEAEYKIIEEIIVDLITPSSPYSARELSN